MVSRHVFTRMAACVLLAGVLVLPAAADDLKDCSFSDKPEAFEACSRLIASKQLRGQELAKVYNTRGSIYRAYKNDSDRAIADHSEAIRITPQAADFYVDRGFIYHNVKHDYDRAIADYTTAIRLDPKSKEAYLRRASSYEDKNDYDRAIADFGEAIRLDPNDSSGYNSRASVYYYHKNDYARAVTDYSEAIKRSPGNALYIASRGEAYEKKGEAANAIADYRAALAIKADNKWALEGLQRLGQTLAATEPRTTATPPAATPGAVAVTGGPVTPADEVGCQDVGAPEAAITACARLIMSGKIGGNELIAAHVWRAWHLTFTGQYDRAIDDYNAALKLDPKLASAYSGRGNSYEGKGDLNRAVSDYRIALSIDPGLQDVPEALQRVEKKLGR